MTNNIKKIIPIGLIVLVFLLILGYSYYRTKDLFRGVVLKIEGITDGETFTEPYVNLSGTAKNSKALYLDGRKIYVDRDWNFKESLILLPGYNIIEVKAFNKFGGSISKNYQIIYSASTGGRSSSGGKGGSASG